MLTYADMITLLAAFFLMLYSMSVVSKGKFQALALSVRTGLGGKLPSGNGIMTGTPGQRGSALPDKPYRQYQDAMRDLRAFVEQHQLGGSVKTRNDSRGVIITLLSDGMLFERGQSDLRHQGVELLVHVAKVLAPLPNDVEVQGHTCNLPIHSDRFPSNWELSTARAGMVLRYFTQQAGLPERRFMAAGYADTRPLQPNDSEAHRARNRRVEIVILKTDSQRAAESQRLLEQRRILSESR